MAEPISTESQSGLLFWEGEYRRHAPALLAFLTGRLKCRDEAEDLMQETFVRAIRAQERIRDIAKVRPYLFSTAHHLLLNHIQRAGSTGGRAKSVHDALHGGGQPATPEAALRARALEERLSGLVQGMPPGEKQAFELGVIKRTPYDEIARQLGWSRSQVKISVFRARKRAMEGLRDLLE